MPNVQVSRAFVSYHVQFCEEHMARALLLVHVDVQTEDIRVLNVVVQRLY